MTEQHETATSTLTTHRMLLDTHQPKVDIILSTTSSIINSPPSPTTISTIPTKEPLKKINRNQGLNTKSTTKVRFSQRVLAREIPHLNDISDQQIEITWYTKQEYSDIKSERKLAVKRQSYGVVLELDTCEELCFRGLEKRTRAGCVLRKTNRLNGVEAVLHEQSRQRLLGLYSSEDVAQAYIDSVYRARGAAHIRGLSDAREALGGSAGEEIHESKTGKLSVQKSKSKDSVTRLKLSSLKKR
jgi:hypothetical protein